MRSLIAILVLVGCAGTKKPANDANVVPVGKATGTPIATQATCEARGTPLDADHVEGARIVDVCIVGASVETTAAVKKALRLGRDKFLTAQSLRSDLAAAYETGLLDQIEATAHSAGPGSALLVLTLQERRRITSIAFEGLVALKDDPLLASFPKTGTPLSVPAVRAISEKLRQEYGFIGFDEAKVDHVIVPEGTSGARLKIVVTEGVRAKVGKVTFDGAKGGREVGLRKAIELDEGTPISDEKVERAALLVNAFYYDAGFMQVRVGDPKRSRGADGTTAVTFPITEGALFRLGKLRVKNLDPAMEKDVLRNITVKSGEIFSRAKLVADLTAIRTKLPRYEIHPETELDAKTGTVNVTLAFAKTQ